MADINARSVEEVLNNYDFRATQKGFKPFYEVKAVGQIKFFHTDDDVVTGRETLEQCLNSQKYCGNTSIFTIAYFTRLDKNGECTGKSSAINVRLNEPGQYMEKSSGSTDMALLTLLKELKDNQSIMASQIKAIQDGDEEEDDEEEEDQSMIGMIKKGWNSMPEQYQAAVFMGALKKFGLLDVPSPSINGVPGTDQPGTDTKDETEKIRTALKIMAKHTPSLGDDLMKLSHIAETNPGQFNMLLSMLRNM